MSPVSIAISSVSRALGSFHPAAMPVLSRGHYRLELGAWLFLPIMMGAVEGGVVSVIAKNAFAGTVAETPLNIAVAVLAGAPAFANITSFLWAALSHGRNKIRFLVGLQIAAALLVAQVALAPANGTGLIMLIIGAVGARVCWSGVVTLRSTVWRANYPRNIRASLAGKLATVQAIMLTGVGLAIALAMRADESSYHLLYPIAAGFGLVGATVYSRLRMRGHAALVANERRANGAGAATASPADLVRILRTDRAYRRYMVAMFWFGIGNLMVAAPLVIVLRDVFGYGYLAGIMIMASIPTLLMPFTIPLWSKFLDRTHIIRFRAVHAWAFIASTACVLIGAVWTIPAFIWLGAAGKGVAYGGGVLGWNLGHHDFSTTENASQYMGVHVTLTGVRGLIGPPLAVGIYEGLNHLEPGAGPWVFAVCLVLNVIGASVFWRMNATWQRGDD